MSLEELKEKGNACVKSENYAEAILHYSQALQLDNNNAALHSNRSLAFLKMHQFFYAFEDAETTINLNPQWAKGYYRKGEVELATGHYHDALKSYTQAFVLEKHDKMLMECLKKAAREVKRDETAELQVPWVGAGIGIVFGVALVLADRLLYEIPTVRNPLIMVGLTVLAALVGFAFCRCYRWYIKRERAALLKPPVDLLGERGKEEKEEDLSEETEEKPADRERPRFSKAQARRRYQKGKL